MNTGWPAQTVFSCISCLRSCSCGLMAAPSTSPLISSPIRNPVISYSATSLLFWLCTIPWGPLSEQCSSDSTLVQMDYRFASLSSFPLLHHVLTCHHVEAPIVLSPVSLPSRVCMACCLDVLGGILTPVLLLPLFLSSIVIPTRSLGGSGVATPLSLLLIFLLRFPVPARFPLDVRSHHPLSSATHNHRFPSLCLFSYASMPVLWHPCFFCLRHDFAGHLQTCCRDDAHRHPLGLGPFDRCAPGAQHRFPLVRSTCFFVSPTSAST